jgi:hypothetical protein
MTVARDVQGFVHRTLHCSSRRIKFDVVSKPNAFETHEGLGADD